MEVEVALLQLAEYIRGLRSSLTQEKSVANLTFEDRLRLSTKEKEVSDVEIAIELIQERLSITKSS